MWFCARETSRKEEGSILYLKGIREVSFMEKTTYAPKTSKILPKKASF
jgi:hypothetical protein